MIGKVFRDKLKELDTHRDQKCEDVTEELQMNNITDRIS
jgi:hypothetical protein